MSRAAGGFPAACVALDTPAARVAWSTTGGDERRKQRQTSACFWWVPVDKAYNNRLYCSVKLSLFEL